MPRVASVLLPPEEAMSWVVKSHHPGSLGHGGTLDITSVSCISYFSAAVISIMAKQVIQEFTRTYGSRGLVHHDRKL